MKISGACMPTRGLSRSVHKKILCSIATGMDGGKKKTPMTQEAKARIMSTQSKQTDGKTPSGSFAARAQSAADKNEPQNKN